MEILGFFSFFGVALIQTYSTVLALAICMITVFSISILCFVIADLDNPFSGFFRLDLSLFRVVMAKGEKLYEQLSNSRYHSVGVTADLRYRCALLPFLGYRRFLAAQLRTFPGNASDAVKLSSCSFFTPQLCATQLYRHSGDVGAADGDIWFHFHLYLFTPPRLSR